MQLTEMFNTGQKGYETPEDDNTALTLSDMRKTKLTLSQINRLRQMKDIRSFEQAKKLETLSVQYAGGSAADETPMM